MRAADDHRGADPAQSGRASSWSRTRAPRRPGLAFLLATIAAFGETGDYTWRDYWADLRANDVRSRPTGTTPTTATFSGGAGEGDRPLVVSYASSPVAEVYFADPQPEDAPTGRRSTAASARSSSRACSPARHEPGRWPGRSSTSCSAAGPGGHPAQHVRVPGQSGRRPLPDVFRRFAAQADRSG